MVSRPGMLQNGEPLEVPHPLGVRDLKRVRLDEARRMAEIGTPGKEIRQHLGALTFEALGTLWKDLGAPTTGVALCAVGSVGRQDAGPASDLDLVLIHDGSTLKKPDLTALAESVWYPIWDAGLALDHSMRSVTECRQVAAKDLAAAAGLLDLTAIAGDASVPQQARAAIMADWRSAARTRLPELLSASRARSERHGELAYLIEPHLKEARGGLRDAVSLSALAATWLADRPHGAVDDAIEHLLDVRDAMHLVTGRSTYVLGRHIADEVAAHMGIDDSDDLLASLAESGRTVAYALDTTERAARRSLEKSGVGSRAFIARRRRGAPRHLGVAEGLIDVDGELALASGYSAEDDALLPLRAAAVAATTGLPFTPSLLEALGRCPALPSPWPEEARQYLKDFLRQGTHLTAVWEALDLHGLISLWFPEWAAVRNRPQRSPIHVFTVDRHSVEAVVQAARFRRHVDNPDLLSLAALFHDIGKRPGAQDHSLDGAALIPSIAARIGLTPATAAHLELLVRHHLLLAELGTSADPSSPDTIEALLGPLGHRIDLLDTLRYLTEADATAAGPKAWTAWRANLVTSLWETARRTLVFAA